MAGETRISTTKFDTKDCAVLIRRSLTGTTTFVENSNISQFLGYSQLNQYLCACLNILKKQRDAGQSVISVEIIQYENVCMILKVVQSRKLKYAKSTYK